VRAGPRLAAGLGVAAVVGLVVLVRPSPSVLRAAVMGGIVLLALGAGRGRSAVPALAAAVLGLLFVDPALAADPGFALSVLATAALVLVAPGWTAGLRRRGVPTRARNGSTHASRDLGRRCRWVGAAGAERIFTDRASGKLARRPQLDALLSYCRPGEVVVITRLDRLGRSLTNLVELVGDLERRGVDLRVLAQNIDTSTPAGRLTFHVLASVGQFERDLISERTHEGLAAARARGRKGGRRPVLSEAKVAHARKLRDDGEHIMSQIAELVGCSRASLYRVLEPEASDAG
jgi:DNA invertase Pin-like site-specific DNA recombinase